jgi:hypothetical protein
VAGGLAIAIARRIARRLKPASRHWWSAANASDGSTFRHRPHLTPLAGAGRAGGLPGTHAQRLQQASDDLLQSRAELEDKVLERTHQLAEKSEALSDQLLFIEVLLDALPSPVFYKGPTPLSRLQPGLRTGLRHHARLSAWQDGIGVALSAPADRVAYHEEDLRIIAEACTSHKRTFPSPTAATTTPFTVRGFRLAMASRAVSSASS